ncbi:hypothetical protein CA13_35210 [Planctomycetes bacterium CA13]|uniref:Transmembrane protein n=1 Tax=Novipirellula herctigrandis TaxID=2527986 RepID=A0A5C5Z4T3_9BACT|nr:hypothetical protein CA13_35210 [Planctomycetes bacterium CA13]
MTKRVDTKKRTRNTKNMSLSDVDRLRFSLYVANDSLLWLFIQSRLLQVFLLLSSIAESVT